MNTSLDSESEFFNIDDDDDEIIVCSDEEFDLLNENEYDIENASFISATEDMSEPSEESSRISEDVQGLILDLDDYIVQQDSRNQGSSTNAGDNLVNEQICMWQSFTCIIWGHCFLWG